MESVTSKPCWPLINSSVLYFFTDMSSENQMRAVQVVTKICYVVSYAYRKFRPTVCKTIKWDGNRLMVSMFFTASKRPRSRWDQILIVTSQFLTRSSCPKFEPSTHLKDYSAQNLGNKCAHNSYDIYNRVSNFK